MYSKYSTAVVITTAVFPTLAIAAVALRFRARNVKHQRYGTDDYIAVLALVFALALCFTIMYGALRASVGQDLKTLTPPQYEAYSKLLYFVVLCAYPAYGLAKVCVLEFYKRIFITKKFHMAANAVLVIVILWMLAAELTSIFIAWPISQYWTFGGQFSMNFGAQALSFASINIVLDFMILCLPIPVIHNLHLDTKHKANLFAIFWMGIFCVIAASVRLYFTYQLTFFGKHLAVSETGFPYISVMTLIWASIESCCSIIAACLPSYGPLLHNTAAGRFMGRSFNSIVDMFNSMRTQRSTSSNVSITRRGVGHAEDVEQYNTQEGQGKWYQLNEGSNVTTVSKTNALSPTYAGDSSIRVERTFMAHAENK